uniref:FYVE-type domain-containing protein n=1 Tax=Globisporangium ultimum (strain ATCC 200006 / CBS 805.95 / DAOM BR144) TaxID=431595 RepID=K3X122_GLOUD
MSSSPSPLSSSSSSAPPSSVASSTSYATTAAAYAHSTLRRAKSQPLATAIKKFPTIALTAEEQAHYDRVVGRLLYRAVQEYGSIGGKTPDSSAWAPVRKKRNLAIYRNVNGTGDPRVSLMIGVGTIDGSLEDVMDGVYCDTTQDLRALKVLLKAQFLAGAILQVSEKRTPDDPFTFAGIKWHAAKTPGGAVSYDRDLVNYERQGMTFDADGNEIAYHLLQSVDRPEWPANVFKNLIRAHTSLCCLYKRTADASKVECFLWGEFFGCGRFPQRLSDYGIAGKWLSVVNAAACSKAKKLSQLKQQLQNKSSASDVDTNVCHVCNERRSMFNTQQPCGACQQNVCKACSKDGKLFELDRAGRVVSDRFCSRCLEVVAKQRGSKITWDGVEAEQPPAYFDYAFQFTSTSTSTLHQSKWLDSGSSISTLWSTNDSANDTRYLDISLNAREFSDSGISELHSEDEDVARRRRTHASRLSSSSSTYATKEEFLADLFTVESPTYSRSSSSSSSSSSSAPPSSVASSTSYATTAAAYAHSTLRRAKSQPLATAIKKFPTIALTTEEQAHYDRVVGRLLYRAVQEYARFDGVVDRNVWTPVRKKEHMAIFRSIRGTGDPRVSLMLGVGKIDGSLEDVMDGVYCDNSPDMRTMKTFLKGKFIIGSIMNVSEKRTPDDPFTFAGIKWFAAKTPGGAVSYDRDLLTYERQGMTFDADGNEIAYHLMQSVDRPEWPANAFKNLIRSHMSLCCLYRRKGNKVETFYWGEFYGSGNFPQRISDYAIAGKWLSTVNAVRCSKAKKLSQLTQLMNSRSSTSSITVSEFNTCYVCNEHRSLFSVQQLCGACRQNVCKACSAEELVFKLDKGGRPMSDRFCVTCLEIVAKQRGSKIYWDGIDAEQPPAYFDYVFHLSGMRPAPETSTTLSDGDEDLNDTSYLDESFKKLGFGGDDVFAVLEDVRRRKRSHADRISNASYTMEQLLSDLDVEQVV